MSQAAYSRKEMAMAHALVADRLLGADVDFLNTNKPVLPLFVHSLFQSMEVSLKHVGIEGGLFTAEEARQRGMRSGHGIQELGQLVYERLGGTDFTPVVMALTYRARGEHIKRIINLMLQGVEFEQTRQSYATRVLGYGEIKDGDMALIGGLRPWVDALKEVAEYLDAAVEVVRKWQQSKGTAPVFAIWFTEDGAEHG